MLSELFSDFENLLSLEDLDFKVYLAFYSIVFLYGIAVGSFLNVLIFRLPKNESLTKSSSHCMTCGAKIKAYDLIPLFSWLILRGKCRNCKEKISPRYPIVEALNGIVYVITFTVLDFNVKSIITALFFSLLIVVGFMDWDTLEMDLRILVSIGVLAVISAILTDELTIPNRIIGGLCVSVPFFLIGEISGKIIEKKTGEKIRGIELGDTILMFFSGLLIGTKPIIVSAAFGIMIAALGGIINKIRTKESKFAFGPYLAIGIAIGTLFGNQMIDAYINWFQSKLTAGM